MSKLQNIDSKIFICHSSNDKSDFVRRLVSLLHQKGPEIWYDEFSVSPSDFIDEEIHFGLEESMGGIVVVSKAFIEIKSNKRDWIKEELYVLLHKRKVNEGFLIPIFYNISRDELPKEYEMLCNIHGFDFKNGDNLSDLTNKIYGAIEKNKVKRFKGNASESFGRVTWNTTSNDCKGLSIINATTLEGYENPCWPSSSVSVNAGEVIAIRIYYHNTGTVTATNTRLVLIPSTSLGNSSSTKSFTGRIVSDQGSVSFNQIVKANISSSQSLTFLSAKWYTNNTSETLTTLLNGQSGMEVMTDNGLYIGSIEKGWATQGSLVVAFRVSSEHEKERKIFLFKIRNIAIVSASSAFLILLILLFLADLQKPKSIKVQGNNIYSSTPFNTNEDLTNIKQSKEITSSLNVNESNDNKEIQNQLTVGYYNSYVNSSLINSSNHIDVCVTIVEDKANNKIESTVSSAIANVYTKIGMDGNTGLLRSNFINRPEFQELFEGNSDIIGKLKLNTFTDYLAIGEIIYSFHSGSLVNGTIVCTASLKMSIISANQKSIIKSFSFSVNGNGVSETQAREIATQKIINKYYNEYSTL
jgi:hypothetical protein